MGGDLAIPVIVFLASAGSVIYLGGRLAKYGDALASLTGLGRLFVGSILVALATSLPELSTNISAVRLATPNPELAVGNIFGANMMNMFTLAVVALIFGGRAFLQRVAPEQGYLIVLAAVITGTAVVLGAVKLDLSVWRIGLTSLVLLAVYVAGMWMVYVTRPKKEQEDVGEQQESISLSRAWLMFGLVSVGVIVAGFFLAWSTDRIAELTGVASSTMGILLVSLVTTMPEASATYFAARLGAADLGVSGLFGSCVFNITILSFADPFYREGILFFMAQPPDGFEVFRQRLRNLPELTSHNTEPLFHNLEADMVYNTGGDLALVPPILQKYWSRFLRESPFVSWDDAAAWYQGLSDDDRDTAGKYLGFEHLDLRSYRSVEARDYGTGPLPGRRDILAREETQRLYDLADQFDLLLGGSQREENFQFWRGYLRDKVDLHQQHRDYLSSLKLARAPDLAASLDFMAGLAGLEPRVQAQKFRDQLPSQPMLVNFLPALDNRSLLLLFASGVSLPGGPTLQATASFVDRLNRFSDVVDRVLGRGRDDPRASAAELTKFLEEIGYEPEDDLRLFFELFRAEDAAAAALVVQALDEETVRRLIVPVPTQLRFILSPEDLLEKLGITGGAQVSDLQKGIRLLVDEPSGNFLIDEPFLHAMYRVVALRSRTQTAPMVTVLKQTPLSLEGFIRQQPLAAADLLDSDHAAALRLIRDSDPVISPAPRIIYRLLQAHPALAARLVQGFDERGEVDLVLESLAYLAYDKARSERAPGLPISLEHDGKFLAALLQTQDADWMVQRLGQAFSLYESRAASGRVSADFVVQFRATLQSAVATLAAGSERTELQRIIARAAGSTSGG